MKVLAWFMLWRVRHDFAWAFVLLWARISQLVLVFLSSFSLFMLAYGGVAKVSMIQSPYGEIPYEVWLMAGPAIAVTLNDFRRGFNTLSRRGRRS
ncbi:MAG: hypothetical protein UT24_C0003G0075 [Candidatus Woesebacteria bacterium GW2011_GWB1_39_12]|uniref:Uncharacterized protein n=1 Tax=Candidatus Woesebacteria bacterium GW2011_GWB1_39_12 TaxID=1618574 RepID=A0A0G0MER2_9BACT|nr:MAG: hypothetical protein UT24_C0003G0075 [Candidatus Woesebacteria bacterium GW2011_GWB1_39_12]